MLVEDAAVERVRCESRFSEDLGDEIPPQTIVITSVITFFFW